MKKMLTALLASVVAVPLSAHANPIGDTLTYQLDLNQLSPPFIGSAGTVTITQDSTNEVDIQLNVQPNYVINTGSKTPFAFETDVSSSSLTVAFLSPDNNNVPGQFIDKAGDIGQLSYSSAGGPGTPYGNFNNAINSSTQNGAPGGFLGILDIHVTRAQGINLSDFVSNGQAIFVADILVTSTGQTGSVATNGPPTDSCNTSITGETCTSTQTVNTPEPASILLLGFGLLGTAAFARRRRA